MSINRYLLGFVISLLITCVSFGLVWIHIASHHQLISHPLLFWCIMALAIAQLVVQVVYFLHIGKESKPRDVLSLIFAASIILFVGLGSLWIMANLALNHGVPYNGAITPQTSED